MKWFQGEFVARLLHVVHIILTMPPRTVSEEIKARILYLYYVENLSVKIICRYLDVRKSCVYKALDYHRKYGVAWNPNACRIGRSCLFTYSNTDALYHFLQQNPCAYLDEMQDMIFQQTGRSVSVATILRTLRRIEVTNKYVTGHALERDTIRRMTFMHSIGEVVSDPNMLVFLDEAAKDERMPGRQKGWSLRGTQVIQRMCFVRGTRYSILPALTLDGIVALEIVNGSVTMEVFHCFLCEQVVSHLYLLWFLSSV